MEPYYRRHHGVGVVAVNVTGRYSYYGSTVPPHRTTVVDDTVILKTHKKLYSIFSL